jgi:hypothetical protein
LLKGKFADLANAPDALVAGVDAGDLPCPKGKKASKVCKKKNGDSDDGDEKSKSDPPKHDPPKHNPPNNDLPKNNRPTKPKEEPKTEPTLKPNCAAIGRNDMPHDGGVKQRALRTPLQDRRLETRDFGFKYPKVCSVKLLSKEYPQSGDKFMVCRKSQTHFSQNIDD